MVLLAREERPEGGAEGRALTVRVSAAERGLDRTFGALADPTRRAVVELLRAEPRRAGDLAAHLAMSAPAMSRHLRVLRATGLVEESHLEADARVRVYRLRPKPFRELASWVEGVESFWTEQLGAFKAHAEARARRRRPSA